MSTAIHLEQLLRRDIDLLRSKVSQMAGLVAEALTVTLKALTERSRRMAYSVILRDQYIDELETEIDRLCLEFLVRHQPVAGDLRFVFATLQINRELERIGDYAESIARQVLAVCVLEPQPPYARFQELGEVSVHMLRDAVQSFEQGNADLARRAMPLEERANTLRNIINAELTELRLQNRIPEAALTPLLNIARRLERAADQTKNMCEEVLYMCTGEFAKHRRADAFRILFFDEDNACLSQMAEAVANSLNLPRFVFGSAGVTPRPVDARAKEFLVGKGIDVSRLASKSIEQVPQWEEYQVLVALGTHAKDALPPGPGKTVRLCWNVPDPRVVTSAEAKGPATFAAVYHSLESHIRDLAGAILDQPQTEHDDEQSF